MALAEKKLPQIWAAGKVIRSESGAPITIPILLEGGPFFLFTGGDHPRINPSHSFQFERVYATSRIFQ